MRQGLAQRSGALATALMLLVIDLHVAMGAEVTSPAPELYSLIQALAKMPALKRDTIEKLVGAKLTPDLGYSYVVYKVKVGDAIISVNYYEYYNTRRMLTLSLENRCLELSDISARFGPLRQRPYLTTDGGPWGDYYSRRIKLGELRFETRSNNPHGQSCISSVNFDHRR